jgi:hypothetical protein
VCGTKNFASVRLYSAPQLHLTIVVILGICAYGTPKQVESRFHTVSASCRTGGEAFGGPSKSEPPSPAPAIARASRWRRGRAIRSRLQSEPGPNPKSKSYLSRPDLCPSYESARAGRPESLTATRWKFTGRVPRLWGIDAPESSQLRRGGR